MHLGNSVNEFENFIEFIEELILLINMRERSIILQNIKGLLVKREKWSFISV
jgi:hypothetical protein